jgi:hypothetical protein
VPTCPECQCEFDDALDICPNCNVRLVSEDDDKADEDLPAEGLVVIETTADDLRVGLLREILEESGIPCFLSNELAPTKTDIAETKVLVPREMVGDARRLMRDYTAPEQTLAHRQPANGSRVTPRSR